MFTIADIRNIAIQIEKNGEETYRRAAQACDDQELSKIFTKMADDERNHARWFQAIATDRILSDAEREMEAVGRTLLQEMVKDNTFSLEGDTLHMTGNLEDLLETSQGFEQDTILFYEMLSTFVDDDETMKQLKVIIAEEQGHFEELKAMAEKISADV